MRGGAAYRLLRRDGQCDDTACVTVVLPLVPCCVDGDVVSPRAVDAEVKKIEMLQTVPAASAARALWDAVLFCGKTSATCDFVYMEGVIWRHKC